MGVSPFSVPIWKDEPLSKSRSSHIYQLSQSYTQGTLVLSCESEKKKVTDISLLPKDFALPKDPKEPKIEIFYRAIFFLATD